MPVGFIVLADRGVFGGSYLLIKGLAMKKSDIEQAAERGLWRLANRRHTVWIIAAAIGLAVVAVLLVGGVIGAGMR